MTALGNQLARFDAIAQAELMRRGEVSATELVEAAIARIEALNPQLNAVVTPLYDFGRAAAGTIHGSSRLAGVPYLLKDLGAGLAGTRQTSGSRALAGYVSHEDSELVRRLRAAGVVIIGKTNTPEFGNHSTTEPVLFGPTRNPWNPDRTAGGSSGGSAAAVASGMVPAAHATDGAGSIRIPASCCGLFGLKPTRGRNSPAPVTDLLGGFTGLSVEHALTRSVRDSAAILDATAGELAGDPFVVQPSSRPFLQEVGADPGRLRIAWSAEPPVESDVAADCVRAARETATLLADLGHDVEEAAPSFDGQALLEPYAQIWALANVQRADEAAQFLGREVDPRELEETTWDLVDYGRQLSATDLVSALAALARASRQVAPFFDRHVAWETPTHGRPPERLGILNQAVGDALGWWHADGGFNPWNPIANMTGHPAMSVPLAWTPDGLPVGTLITGRFGDEATLFRLAGQLEAARPWAERIPPIHAANAEPTAPGATARRPA